MRISAVLARHAIGADGAGIQQSPDLSLLETEGFDMSQAQFEKAAEIIQSLPKDGPVKPSVSDQLTVSGKNT